MTFSKYRFFDLTFFTVIGIVSVLLSEGLLLLFTTSVHLSLTLFIGLLLGVRWGWLAILPYSLILLVGMAFNNNYEIWYIFAPLQILMALSFMTPVVLIRRFKKDWSKRFGVIFQMFILGFLTQVVTIAIYASIIDQVSIFAAMIGYLASQLFNVIIILVLMILTYKVSSHLYRDMNQYFIEVQKENESYE